MKIRSFLFIFIAAFATSFFFASCLNEENKIPPNCYDGILNNGEEKIDCGGAFCEECPHCENGRFDPDRGETCVDCGGPCGECPTCNNCMLDEGLESGIDCGGFANCQPCEALCGDGLLNGVEEEIDCGGVCEACPTCTDTIMNGTEIGIDCGGLECEPCSTPGSCINGVLDGDEWWVDCSGSHCPACLSTFSWRIGNNTFNSVVVNGTITDDLSFQTVGVAPTLPTETQLNLSFANIIVFAAGQNFNATPTTAGVIQASYTNAAGVLYSSANTGSNLSISIQRYIAAENFIRFTFSGTLKSDDGLSTVQIQNGVYMADLP